MSSLINNYTKPTAMELRQDELHADTSVEEYDHNYIYDVVTLSSDRVELRPLVPSRDAKGLFEAFQAAPQLTDYLFDSYNTLEDVLRPTERYRRDPSFLYYAIYSARPGPNAHEEPKESYTLAGGLAIFRTSEEDQSAEIGHVTIFPEFQRTHVLTHAAGLLMHRILDDESLGGMNLRRCQWFTNSLNKPSQAAALRLGYTFEGILRSHRMLPVGKRGAHAGRKGEFEAQNSRDSWLSSVTWEEWEGGVRDHVDKLMSRRE